MRNLVKLILVGVLLTTILIPAGGTQTNPEQYPYERYPGVTLTVAVLSGVHHEPWDKYLPKFEELTGVKVELVEIPFGDFYEKTMLEAASHSGAYDIIELPGMWIADFAVNGFIVPLDKYLEKWDWHLKDIVEKYREISAWGENTWSAVEDGDVFALYYRKDLFEDPQNKREFKEKYGHELKVPRTWNEFMEVGEFFTRDTDGDGEVDFWGASEMLTRTQAPLIFSQRLQSYNGEYFDPQTMEPAINSSAGIKALKSLKEEMDIMPPGVINYGFAETRDAFTKGRTAMLVQWPDIGPMSGDPRYATDEVIGNVGYALVPGGKINGKIHKASELCWNWQLVISADTSQKKEEAAAQLLHYWTSPEVSLGTVKTHSGYDSYRYSHFESPKLAKGWFPGAADYLEALRENMKYGVYDLMIPGTAQYYDTLAKYLASALTGEMSAESALNKAAKEWENITNRLGRQSQLEWYRRIHVRE